MYDCNKMRSHLLEMLLNKCINHFPGNINSIPRNVKPDWQSYNKDIIINNRCLDDIHIHYFHEMLRLVSTYKSSSTWFLQDISRILEIDENDRHIQILFIGGSPVGHFICTYYDTAV